KRIGSASVATKEDGRSGGDVLVWDAESGREVLRRALPSNPWGVSFGADADRLAVSGDFGVKVWDLGKAGEAPPARGHTDGVSSVAVTPDGRTLVSGSKDRTAKVWDLATGQLRHTLAGHAAPGGPCAVGPGG